MGPISLLSNLDFNFDFLIEFTSSFWLALDGGFSSIIYNLFVYHNSIFSI